MALENRGNFQLAREKCQAALMGAEGNAAMAAMSLEVGAMIQARCDTLCGCIGNSLDTKLAKNYQCQFWGTRNWSDFVQYFNLNHPVVGLKDVKLFICT